jgi:Ser/Thr protein kinase RdoA (MazF antagonist)
VHACLAQDWGLPNAEVIAHHGGMGSVTWFVSQGDRRWVAKAVAPALRPQFLGGLQVAAALETAGIPTGPPVPTCLGRLVVTVDDQALALLTWVEGEELTGASADEQRVIGETLRRVHRTLQDVVVAGVQRFHWVRPQAPHLALRPGFVLRFRLRSRRWRHWAPKRCRGACCTPIRRPSTSGWSGPADGVA